MQEAMSARIPVRRAALARSRLYESIAAGGRVATALVSVGGLALGFMVWLAVAAAGAIPRSIDDAAFLAFLLLGVCAAFAGWYAYATYFSARTGASLHTALVWDAPSWAALIVFPVLVLQSVYPLSLGRCEFIAVALWSLAKLVAAARFNRTVRDVTVTFFVTRIAIIVIAELAYVIVGQRAGTHAAISANPLLAVWGRWDAVHYVEISQRGYYGTDMAFFPLYPTLIHLLTIFIGNALVAGLLIANAALFFGLLFCYKLVEHMYNRSVAQRTIFYISIFPTAVFFSAAYTESLFFALTVASFYYIREHRWLVAGVLGGLAALTRVEGVLLFVPYLMEAYAMHRMLRDRDERPFLLRACLGAAIIPCGLLIYMVTLWVLRGDPLYFSHVQAHWDRHLAPPWQSLWHSVKIIAKGHPATSVATQSIELSFTLLMLGVLAAGFKKLPLSLWTYMALSVIVPMSTSSLMSMPRFALVLFPMFIVFALWGEKQNVNSAIVAFSLPLLGLFTVLFANWYWVA
jgi:hypothetical protein